MGGREDLRHSAAAARRVISPTRETHLLDALAMSSTEARRELIDNRGQSLTRDVRREVQRALSEEGEYSGAIDGDFGPGTIGALESYAEWGDW